MSKDKFEYKRQQVELDIGVLGDQVVEVDYIVRTLPDGTQRVRVVMVMSRDETLHEYEVMKLEDMLIDVISSTQPDEE